MSYGFTDTIEKLRIDMPAPPRWVKQVFRVSILVAIYMLGVSHGIQIGGHGQAAGSSHLVGLLQLPTTSTMTMPWPVAGSTEYAPTHEVITFTSRAQDLAFIFSLVALATVVGWIVAEDD